MDGGKNHRFVHFPNLQEKAILDVLFLLYEVQLTNTTFSNFELFLYTIMETTHPSLKKCPKIGEMTGARARHFTYFRKNR